MVSVCVNIVAFLDNEHLEKPIVAIIIIIFYEVFCIQ